MEEGGKEEGEWREEGGGRRVEERVTGGRILAPEKHNQ